MSEEDCRERMQVMERELEDSKRRESELRRLNEALLNARKKPQSGGSSQSPQKPSPSSETSSTIVQLLERKVHDLELDLRHAQVQSEREKMELREIVQQLRGDKTMLAFNIARLEEELKTKQNAALPRISEDTPMGRISEVSEFSGSEPMQTRESITNSECQRLREQVQTLQNDLENIQTKAKESQYDEEEVERLREENEALREELEEWRKGKNTQMTRDIERERDALYRQLTSLKASYASLEQAFNDSQDLSETSKLHSENRAFPLDRTATFNSARSREFEPQSIYRKTPQKRGLDSSFDERNSHRGRVEVEKLRLAVDRAVVERDRARLELQEKLELWEKEKALFAERQISLEHHVKYLIGKLLKAKGKHEVSANETMRSWSSNRSALAPSRRKAASPLNISVISRAESPYSVSEIELC